MDKGHEQTRKDLGRLTEGGRILLFEKRGVMVRCKISMDRMGYQEEVRDVSDNLANATGKVDGVLTKITKIIKEVIDAIISFPSRCWTRY